MQSKLKKKPVGSLLIAFPKSNTELRLVFSTPVDQVTAGKPENYRSEKKLKILSASVDPTNPKYVILQTEPMNGEAMKTDIIRAVGVRTVNNSLIVKKASPRFLHGIASIPGVQKRVKKMFPFRSKFNDIVATLSCQKDGGVNSNHLIDTLGYSFLHKQIGGPFNSIKVVVGIGKKHVPGIDEEVERLAPKGLSPHVLWSGGLIQNVKGETQLVDTGFIEGSIMKATPKKFPPPYLIKTRDLITASTLRGKSLQGIIVCFENVIIDKISQPDKRQFRKFVFHDDSEVKGYGFLLDTVKQEVKQGQKFQVIRALVHLLIKGHYEVIVEMDKHLVDDKTRINEPLT
jgi:hypothetical protein